eukprot:4860570-Karenia_brevis.AAC.1
MEELNRWFMENERGPRHLYPFRSFQASGLARWFSKQVHDAVHALKPGMEEGAAMPHERLDKFMTVLRKWGRDLDASKQGLQALHR